MKYAPLPWVHLQNALHAPNRRIRLVFNEDGVTGERNAKLYVGPHNMPMVNVHEILEEMKACLNEKRQHLTSPLRPDCRVPLKVALSLTKAQVGRFKFRS